MDIAVIGLGALGQDVARELLQRGAHVVGIDRDRDRVHRLHHPHYHAVVMDATDEEDLQQLGVDGYAAVVITMHNELSSTMLATDALKRLGARHVICIADVSSTREALLRVGADRVLQPYEESARRLAWELAYRRVGESVAVTPGSYLATVELPGALAGQPLSAVSAPGDEGSIAILAVQRGEQALTSAPAGFRLLAGDLLLVLGSEEAIAALANRR